MYLRHFSQPLMANHTAHPTTELTTSSTAHSGRQSLTNLSTVLPTRLTYRPSHAAMLNHAARRRRHPSAGLHTKPSAPTSTDASTPMRGLVAGCPPPPCNPTPTPDTTPTTTWLPRRSAGSNGQTTSVPTTRTSDKSRNVPHPEDGIHIIEEG